MGRRLLGVREEAEGQRGGATAAGGHGGGGAEGRGLLGRLHVGARERAEDTQGEGQAFGAGGASGGSGRETSPELCHQQAVQGAHPAGHGEQANGHGGRLVGTPGLRRLGAG